MFIMKSFLLHTLLLNARYFIHAGVRRVITSSLFVYSEEVVVNYVVTLYVFGLQDKSSPFV